ncbi:uncharacterized protein F5891DRAFT_958552 [Suillus fuscotomentosus]|uniref:VIT domain-containing protein n=1 Tax=Suillus fuscotomentosus TaxID=1912939 RepID=A0AAD4DYP2_9AGAM|nr:uncharacterized protein F5891DRAFT_958552 [Suillus fuscotomentosus]KAG1896545.1 hypothetical protein F5891DRAFT_958552 [Suillus fuscotomentosus]
MTRYAGIVYRSLDQRLLHLPLQEVDVRVWMVDVSAKVMVHQIFENESESPTSRAKYVFPFPANAAICAFELEHADGRVITGITEEKSEAAEAFHGAMDAGMFAGSTELFTLSVGSIPARQKITTRLTFVMNLFDEARQDHICLRLPMTIAKRYGETPTALLNAPTTNERTRVHITVDVQTSDVIQDIRSPTHRISTPLRYRKHASTKSERRMTAKWSSTTFLDRDFVLTVHAHGLNEPRCFAEVHPQRADTIAMQLSFVPKFEMPRVAPQEYIFVIDRSSSMIGAPMETTKRTLAMLLHLLPDSDTTFNIFSEVDGMWETSMPFNDRNMQYAVIIFCHRQRQLDIEWIVQISNIQAIQANNSGTKFAHVLQLAVASRDHNRPTTIFVLTGGGIHPGSSTNSDPFEVVSAAVDSCRPNAPLKLYTLWIGEHVASVACERLARSSVGECLLAAEAEDMIRKCARLLAAGRTGVIESVVVDWHGSGIPPAINFLPSNYCHSLPLSQVVQPEPLSPIQQVPHRIMKIFPEMHLNVFAITTFRSIPPEVRLRVKVEGLARVLELVVPVMVVKQPFEDKTPLLHTLAAQELIKHLAEGRIPLPRPVAPTTNEEVRKMAIVQLGLEYQLASQYTSFVTIEPRREMEGSRLHWTASVEGSPRQHYNAFPPSITRDAPEDYALGMDAPMVQTVLDNLSWVVNAVFDFFTPDAAPTYSRRQNLLPGTYYSTAQSRSSLLSSQSARPFHHDNSSTDTFSTLSSLEGSSTNSQWTHSRSSSPLRHSIQRIPSPVFSPTRNAHLRARLPRRAVVSDSHPLPVPKEVYALILLQGYDGSFTPSPPLEALVGVEILEMAADLQVSENVWATAVVVAYLKHHLGAQPDFLHILLSKPLEYVEGKGKRLLAGREFSDLVAIAGRSVG